MILIQEIHIFFSSNNRLSAVITAEQINSSFLVTCKRLEKWYLMLPCLTLSIIR